MKKWNKAFLMMLCLCVILGTTACGRAADPVPNNGDNNTINGTPADNIGNTVGDGIDNVGNAIDDGMNAIGNGVDNVTDDLTNNGGSNVNDATENTSKRNN